ncbi:hypothetical protein EJB05_13718 [Eragrostis curvula]|uniref:Uncharacterized protein n=1 Tax=Eragrostis curvula TaxID=38414 RepID=A0A5J9VY37_9POAL|nr:hypothetical protein EJB05_13718 [Eragrostis curvula]
MVPHAPPSAAASFEAQTVKPSAAGFEAQTGKPSTTGFEAKPGNHLDIEACHLVPRTSSPSSLLGPSPSGPFTCTGLPFALTLVNTPSSSPPRF